MTARLIPAAMRGVGDLYRLVWTYAHGYRALYVVGLLLQAGGFACALGIPLFLGLAVGAAQRDGGHHLAPVMWWLAMIVVAVVAAWALNAPGRLIERRVSLEVHRALVDDLVRRALHVDMRWHENRHSGDTTHRIQATVRAVVAFSECQTFLIRAALTFVGATVAMAIVNPVVGAAAVVGFLVLGALTIGRDAGLRERLDSHHESVAQLSGAVTDVLGNITTVATLGAGEPTRRRVRRVLDDIARRGRLILVPMERKWWLITSGSGLMHGLLLGGFALLDWRATGAVHAGQLVIVSGYAASMHTAFEIMGGQWQSVLLHQAEARSAGDLLAAALRDRTSDEIPAGWSTLLIEDLELRHPPRDGGGPDVVGVTATAVAMRRGQRIAVVGASGAGKSSFLRALAGIYGCSRFSVSVDGEPVPHARSLAGTAGLIAQETEVFTGTMRANLDLGTAIGEERIVAATTAAELDELLARLPEGLDTDLVERGVNLSGGEKQRVGLARGLLHTEGASLLLLDEPTSNLDPVTEARIYTNLFRSRPATTIVSAVHRLHLLRHFDTVLFLSGGAVVDVGSCAEVASRQPDFARLLDAAGGLVTSPDNRVASGLAVPA